MSAGKASTQTCSCSPASCCQVAWALSRPAASARHRTTDRRLSPSDRAVGAWRCAEDSMRLPSRHPTIRRAAPTSTQDERAQPTAAASSPVGSARVCVWQCKADLALSRAVLNHQTDQFQPSATGRQPRHSGGAPENEKFLRHSSILRSSLPVQPHKSRAVHAHQATASVAEPKATRAGISRRFWQMHVPAKPASFTAYALVPAKGM
ncbi:hypothetical protein BDY21DRAFT_331727 [Lineolata rhizophorae]|uniref:Uncharacterized protein n=1 Tax=Lineolata rhizophorae TaxID=578093 RepID=A0A6A6PBL5_9PEZI|nr:hypothetical protein BDY21DRAFT_331727 [Lineolata rhizophorae]